MSSSKLPTSFAPESERRTFRHSVVVLHGPTDASVGSRVIVPESLEFGRGGPGLPSDAPDDRLLSRKHARFSAEHGVFEVEDLGSLNGTFVNGERVEKAVLGAGDVIEVGEFALIVDPAFPRRERPMHPRIVGTSQAVLSHLDSLEAAAQDGNVILYGPAGAGKSLAVQELHRMSRRKGALIVAPCDRPAEILKILTELLRDNGSLTDAFGGTLVLDSIDRARRDDVRKLPSVLGLSRERGIRIVLCSRAAPMDLSNDLEEYAQILQGIAAVEVPPLDARREDIPRLVRHFFAPLGKSAPELSREFVAKLVRGHASDPDELPYEQAVLARAMGKTVFPDNVRGLFTQLDSCLGMAAIGGDLSDVDPPGDDDEEPDVPPMRPARVARDGTFIQVERERVHLRGRRALRSMLALLVNNALTTPWEAVPVASLFIQGWPDDHPDELAAAARVYLAMSTLRRVGLEGHLERTQVGYRLVISGDLELVEPKPIPRTDE